jgi:hypothetical protein
MAGEGKSELDDYNKPGHVDPPVIETLATFIAGLPK